MTQLDDDVAVVVELLDRDQPDRARRVLTTYVDVVREMGHERAQAALAELEGRGVVDWASNGVVRRRRGVRP